jgi:hypothetical protein
MRNHIFVNSFGQPGHFIAIDLNIVHRMGYIKALFAAKGIHADWDRLGSVSAAMQDLLSLEKKLSEALELFYQGSRHTNEDVSALVWQVVNTTLREYSCRETQEKE